MVDLNIELSKDFFEEETKCDFYISKNRKQIWAVELDLLYEFDRVCQKYNLRYFLDGGTLLGAVRHNGFIPWDDDVDLTMMRNDYKKLCSIASTEFKHPYFFQTEETDPGSLRCHAQLRNSNTTGILMSELIPPRTFNQGIFIDIFPLDKLPDDKTSFESLMNSRDAISHKMRSALYWGNYGQYSPASNIIKSIIKKICWPAWERYNKNKYGKYDYKALYVEFENTISKYNDTDCTRIAKLFFGTFKDKYIWRTEDYSDVTYLDFEMLRLPAPIGYKNTLRTFYGDWETPVKSPTTHGGVKFDVDISYKDYIAKGKYKEWL